jgi:Arc/MetJ family transcription regulator
MGVAKDEIHRTTIDIELEAFEGAREALGTKGYRDTVNGALHAVSRAAALGRAAELIRAGGLGLTTPEELEELRGVDRSNPP